MRQLNSRLLGVLAVCGGLIAGCLYGVHRYQIERHSDAILREARAAVARKDFQEAVDLYDMFVASKPKIAADQFDEIGDAQVSLGKAGLARISFENALRDDPDRADIRLKLVKLFLAVHRVLDSRQHLDILMRDDPENPEYLILRAQCDGREKRYEDACGHLQRALEIDPKRLDAAGLLAYILSDRMANIPQATARINEMVKNNEDNPDAYVVRGGFRISLVKRMLTQNTNLDVNDDSTHAKISDANDDDVLFLPEREKQYLSLAEEDSKKALTLAPDSLGVLRFAIQCGLFSRKYAETVEVVEHALEIFPDSPEFYASMSEVLRHLRKFEEAINWLEEGLKRSPGQPDMLWNLANAYIDLNRLNDSDKVIRQLKQLDHPRPLLWFLDARRLMVQQQWFEASQEFQRVRPALIEWPEVARQADFFLGGCLEQLGRFDQQLIAFRSAIMLSPNWLPARMGIARALLMTGKIEEAMEEYGRVAALPGARLDVFLQLTRIDIMLNLRRDKAKRSWATHLERLDRIEKIDPTNPAIAILRAEILVAEDKMDDAVNLLKAALEKNPDSIEYWLAAAALADRRDDWDEAAKILDAASARLGDTVPIRLARARHAVNQHGKAALAELKKLEENVSGFSDEDRSFLQTGLASLMMAIGEFRESERLCRIVAELEPFNLRIRLTLFDLAYLADNVAVMESVLNEVKGIERSGPLWHYGEAVRCTVRARTEDKRELFDEAMKHLTESRLIRPNWSRVPLLMGQINDAQGDESTALGFFLESIELGERAPAVISHAVTMLYQRRRFNDADKLIRRLQEQQSPFSNDMNRLAAEVSLRLNETERARDIVTRAQANSSDPKDFIWAGRVFSALGRNADAEETFRKAVTLDPKMAEAWVALIQHFGRTLQIAKAEQALEDAKENISQEEAPLALAVAFESIERIEEAEKRFRDAVIASGNKVTAKRQLVDFLLRQSLVLKAEPELMEILKRKSDVTDEEKIWARRNMALILITRGGEADVNRALEFVNENLRLSPDSELEQRAQAMVQAYSHDKKVQAEAAEKLERILKSQRYLDPDGYAEIEYALARVYVSIDDVSNAGKHLRALIASAPNNPRFLTYYIRFLVDLGEFVDAEHRAEELMKVAPHQIETIILMSEIKFRLGRLSEIITLFNNYVGVLTIDGITRQNRLKESSGRLEVLSRQAAKAKHLNAKEAKEWSKKFKDLASDLYRRYSTERPDSGLELAIFLARQGKHTEAFDMIEKNSETAKPEEIAMVAAALLASVTATQADFDRGAGILKEAMKKHEGSVVLELALADLLNWDDKFAAAQELYLKVLEQADRHPGALNNLALMMALNGDTSKKPLELINKTIEVLGPIGMILDSRGTIYLLRGNYKEAAADLMKSVSSSPSGVAYFHLAQVQMKQNNRNAAKDSMSRASELGLRVEELHPRERPHYRQLVKDLQSDN